MGLFKKIGKVAGATFGGVGGFMLGGALGGMLDGDEKGAQRFIPGLKQFDEDTKVVRDIRDKPITELTKAGQVQTDQLKSDKLRSLASIDAAGQSRFQALQDSIARQGGLSSGAGERLARQSGREATMARQKASSDFQRLISDVSARDFAGQQAFQRRATLQAPQYSLQRANIMNQAMAANMRAKALRDANKAAMFGAIGQIGGAVAGGMLGGPMGASVGSSVGGGLFTLGANQGLA